MPTYTTRTALVKPSGSASPAEPVDITQLNANADQIDRFLGCILVNDGVTPATADLFDGAIVKEKTSGIIWEARKNGGGTFDKVYIAYPYHFYAYTALNNYAISGTTFFTWNYATYYATQAKNSSAAQLVAGAWVCPVKGIYEVRARDYWAANATGTRASVLRINGGNDLTNTLVSCLGDGTSPNALTIVEQKPFNVGDTVHHQVYQSSGGALNLDSSIAVTMICPVQ